MKYIKKYEDINIGKPKIGDYAILNLAMKNLENRHELENQIGIIKDIDKLTDHLIPGGVYWIEFEDGGGWWCGLNEIEYFSDNKEELKPLLKAKKYNL